MANKFLYFNLNYRCNNACLFCASGLVSDPPVEMSYSKVAAALKTLNPGDSVMLNGGEPTLFKRLPDVLQSIKKAQARAVIYTNGRRLKDLNYAKAIVSKMSGTISIPLYGLTAKMHDYFTGRKGSFADTWQGIKNVLQARNVLNSDLELEVKLLFLKPLLKVNPKLARALLATLYPHAFTLSLNSLLISKAVEARRDKFVPSLKELKSSVDKTLRVIPAKSSCHITMNLPLCLVPGAASLAKRKRPILESYYYDPFSKMDRSMPPVLPNTSKKFSPLCKKCKLISSCNYSSK